MALSIAFAWGKAFYDSFTLLCITRYVFLVRCFIYQFIGCLCRRTFQITITAAETIAAADNSHTNRSCPVPTRPRAARMLKIVSDDVLLAEFGSKVDEEIVSMLVRFPVKLFAILAVIVIVYVPTANALALQVTF